MKTQNNTIYWISKSVRTVVIALGVSLMLVNCQDEVIPTITRLHEIQFGDKKYRLVNDFAGGIIDCERLSLGISQQRPEGALVLFFNILKNGALTHAYLVDYSLTGGQNRFETADFNPTGLLKISNFKYDEATNYVHFEYSGELIKVEYTFDNRIKTPPRITIKREVTVNNLTRSECKTFLPTARFETPALTFVGTNANATHDPSLKTNPYIHRIYSNNGYRIFFKLKEDFWTLKEGKTYTFDQNTIENRIDFDQYTGIFKATELLWIIDEEWKKFKTSGSYTILEHKMINGKKVTIGEVNLQAYENGVLLHNVSKGVFETGSF